MHRIKVNHLLRALDTKGQEYVPDCRIEVSGSIWDTTSESLLEAGYRSIGGLGNPPKLRQLRLDFQIDRCLFVFDDEVHFNRYRLETLQTGLYGAFYFPWQGSYVRLCRQFERQCLQAGMQERVWYGPPLAAQCFGNAEPPGDLSGNGSSGWKLNAYNDLQYDLISRLQGYKLIRISGYETLLISGSLKKVDQLLLRPDEKTRMLIANWLVRKTA
ncbi:hypothetical protein ADIS_2923 [Lunatimonas lonarensis]|uniref:Uncharacterized protein n=1 Tax=Lunatimonas lonarensis TaxID=1232681 RepID=R7ZQZ1_9BACT|nr:hypothetical protein [Lunatimonas lonarensis]EON76473.1 hypothetical protein ADIS_2923 [Lunatimonas lonarensis]